MKSLPSRQKTTVIYFAAAASIPCSVWTKRTSEPGDGGGVPGGRDVAADVVGERERAAVQAEVEERDEVAVHGEAFGGGRVLRPGTAVQVEAGVEQPRRDLPLHRAPLVEQLRHLKHTAAACMHASRSVA